MTAAWGAVARRWLLWLWSWLRRHWSELSFALLAVALFIWVASDAFTSRIVTVSQGADYWEHSATLRELLERTWHPGNPHLVSTASSPRFVPPFIVAALIAKPCGFDALGAMGVASCLNMLLLFSGVFLFFRSYFRDARASLYGLIVMFASWYDGWHFSNVYQLKVFFSTVSYPSTAALGLSLLGFTLVLRALRGPGRLGLLIATSVCWAVVMVTHPLTAMLGFSGAMLLALTEPSVPWKLRARVATAILLGGLLSLFWPYFSVSEVLRGGSHEQISTIAREFASEGESEPSGKLHPFYRQVALLQALGVALAGLPVCLYLIVRRRHWFISLGALAMLLPFVVNAYLPLPLGHRFILLAIFFLQTALVWLLLKLSRGSPEAWLALTAGWRGWLSGAFVGAVLLTLLWWNVGYASRVVGYGERRMRGAQSINVRYARRVGELASGGVVLADKRNSWPVPTFGPKVLVLLHGNPLLLDEAERNAAVSRFFQASTPEDVRLEIIARWGVTHVLARRAAARRIEPFLSRHGRRHALPGGYVLYQLRPSGE